MLTAGSVDLTFGTDFGSVKTAIGSLEDSGNDIAIQADGRILVAGYSHNGSNNDFAIARYNVDGTLDTAFSGDGKASTGVGSSDDFAQSVATQPDGKIVVAGYSHNGSNYDFSLVRFSANGSLDSSFDGDGRVLLNLGPGNDYAYDVAIQSDGKIVVSGSRFNGGNYDLAVMRYLPSGAPDSAFGSGGLVFTNLGPGYDEGLGVALQSDGKIVVAGYSFNGSNNDFALVRYNASGSLDSSFSGDGIVTASLGPGNDLARDVAIQSDGKIVVAGSRSNGSHYDFAVMRFLPDGAPDAAFGSGGLVVTAVGPVHNEGLSVALQSDGKIVVAGDSYNGGNYDFAVARYNSDGGPDASFDGDGMLTSNLGSGNDYAFGVALQGDGKIVAAGGSWNGSNADFAVARYEADGARDPTFRQFRGVATGIGSADDTGRSVALQSDGKIVVAGYSYNGSNTDFSLVRYNADGSLDTSFDSDGKATSNLGPGNDFAYDVALQSDGKIVVSGSRYNGANYDFAVVRYLPTGALDTTFGSGGLVFTNLGPGNDEGLGVALQSDGKIVVAGYTFNGSNNDFALVRYNPSGSLDPSFSGDGIVTTNLGPGPDNGWDLAIQSDGKIVVAGSRSNGANYDFAVMRHLPNGAVDSAFGSGGLVFTNLGPGNDEVLGVAVQSDGKIVVAGYASNGSNNDFALVRYSSSGTLDSSFSTDGIVATNLGPGADIATDVVIQNDGKILVAGRSSNGVNDDFALTRYDVAGALDASFDADGKVLTPVGSSVDVADSVALQPDGKIVAAGSSFNGANYDFAVVRYLGDPANAPPTADAGGPYAIQEGDNLALDASGSSDPDVGDSIVSYAWDLDDDGQFDDLVTPSPTANVSWSTLVSLGVDDGLATYDVGVEVTDGLGAASSIYAPLTVDNVAPTIALSGAASVDEGSTYTLTLGAITDPGLDTVTEWRVDWGDGSLEETFFAAGDVNHVYADGLTFPTITVDLLDEDGLHLNANTVGLTVNNVAPTISLSGAASVDEGSTYSLTLGGITDPGQDAVYEWHVDWGDGSAVETFTSAGDVTHVYADGGATPTITVDVLDEDGPHLAVGTLALTVDNVAPTISLSGAASVDEGSVYTLTLGSITDPGLDSVYEWRVVWGDGLPEETFYAADDVEHVYADGMSHPTISVSLLDEDGLHVAAGTLAIDVDDVAPTIDLFGAERIDEGAVYTLTLGAIADPGQDTVVAWRVDWGDRTPVETYAAGGDVTHMYLDENSDPTISVALIDEDGTHAAAGTLTIDVDSVAAELVADINQATDGSAANTFVEVGGVTYFLARDTASGQELWRTDGSEEGTRLVKDIWPGVGDSRIRWLTNLGGTLYFSADDGANGYQLWRSDGTDAGTNAVTNIAGGQFGFQPSSPVNMGGVLFFSARDSAHGFELWRSDGTEAGTYLVKDLDPSPSGGSSPGSFTNVGGLLLFSARDPVHGTELWRSDGTEAGTYLVRDIRSGTASSNPRNLVEMSGTLYFEANDIVSGRELWRSDGTAAGTQLVKDIVPGSYGASPSSLTNVSGLLYFSAGSSSESELWRSDGTSDGTIRVKDINPSGSSSPRYLTNVGGLLYFSANDGVSGRELWRSDGTDLGTYWLADLRPGTPSAYPGRLTNVDGVLYFAASQTAIGQELWRSDGTAAGTYLIEDLRPGFEGSDPRYLANVAGELYFMANDGAVGMEPWRTDGLPGGARLLKDILTSTFNSSSNISEIVEVDGIAYFMAEDVEHGRELWRSDGTASGTYLVKDILPGRIGSSPGGLANIGGVLYFSANDGAHGYELWRSDGTALGTYLVHDLQPGAGGSQPFNLTNVSGMLYFVANDGLSGHELWRSDGTAGGAYQVADIRPGIEGSSPQQIYLLGGVVSFAANDGAHGTELWRSDGTPAGTYLVQDIRPGLDSSSPHGLTAAHGALYFSANDGVHGHELWRSDGTPAGTHLFRDMNPGSGGSSPYGLTLVNGSLFFSAYEGLTGQRLWKSDGTELGTQPVGDASNPAFNPVQLTNVSGTLYFRGWNHLYGGYAVWRSDGTSAGTHPVQSGYPWEGAQYPFYLTNVGGTLYFRARDLTSQYELWRSDGTSAGTYRVEDIVPGYVGSYPSNLTNVGGTLFFAASDPTLGRELWRYVPPNTAPVAMAGGPYTIGEGASLSVDASASFDPDGDAIVNYSWDLNADDVFGDATGPTPTLDWLELLSLGMSDGPSAYEVRVQVTDSEGATTTSPPTLLTIANVAPSNVAIEGAAASVAEGAGITLTPSFFDPAETLDAYSYIWTVTKNAAPFATQSGTTPPFTFTPDDDGVYEVSLVVSDEDGGTGAAIPVVVTATNVAPTIASLALDGEVDEGGNVSLSFTYADPGDGDTHLVDIDWNGDGLFESQGLSASGGAFSTVHTYADDAPTGTPFDVTSVNVRLRDDDGDSATDSADVSIRNVAPTVSIVGAPASSVEGTLLTLFRSVIDPGTDTFSYAWSVTRDGLPYGATGDALSFPFTPGDNGQFVVTLTVTDDDQGVGSQSVTIVVDNAAPQLTSLAVDSQVDEGGGILLVGEFSDAGADDVHTLDVDWDGDGQYDELGLVVLGVFALPHTYADDDPSGTPFDVTSIGVRVADDEAATVEGDVELTVHNVAPSEVFIVGAPASPEAGVPITLTSSFVDPAGSHDTYTYAWTVTKNAAPYASQIATNPDFGFTPDAAGVYEVSLTITDDDTGSGLAAPVTMVVTRPAPRLGAGSVVFSSTTTLHPAFAPPTGNGEQLRTVPVANVDTIAITFPVDVAVALDDLSLTGDEFGAYALAGFHYDALTFTATWTLAAPIGADRLILVLSDSVTDPLGGALDGEWDNPTDLDDASSSTISGDGLAGGDFEFHFSVLPGDANRDNRVTGADYTIWADGYDGGLGPADKHFTQGDFNGDGHTTGADYTIWADHYDLDLTSLAAEGQSAGNLRAGERRPVDLAPPAARRADAAPAPGSAAQNAPLPARRASSRRAELDVVDALIGSEDWLREALAELTSS